MHAGTPRATGRMRMAAVYACTARDCDHAVLATDFVDGGRCPVHDTTLKKARRRVQVKKGVVDCPPCRSGCARRGPSS